jgi:hypothetical protein
MIDADRFLPDGWPNYVLTSDNTALFYRDWGRRQAAAVPFRMHAQLGDELLRSPRDISVWEPLRGDRNQLQLKQ